MLEYDYYWYVSVISLISLVFFFLEYSSANLLLLLFLGIRRVEPSVDFYCDIDYDPFLYMKENKMKYGKRNSTENRQAVCHHLNWKYL